MPPIGGATKAKKITLKTTHLRQSATRGRDSAGACSELAGNKGCEAWVTRRTRCPYRVTDSFWKTSSKPASQARRSSRARYILRGLIEIDRRRRSKGSSRWADGVTRKDRQFPPSLRPRAQVALSTDHISIAVARSPVQPLPPARRHRCNSK